ncbi:hypothetical protein OEZ73_26740, partial [Leclercia adecarboxylata]|nr:hypothetical protein [Leclercia adecarboxylata]
VQRLFDELADLAPDAREPMLAASKERADLIGHVRQLLSAHDSVGILDGDKSAATSAYSSLSPGAQVGDFVIDRLIGRGGMGEVYDAHRDKSGFVQRAAIKMLRPEAVDQASLFDRERRLLAGLEHPGIARLIDGG